MKTQAEAIHKEVLITALNAISEKRLSSQAINEYVRILLTIQANSIMKQQWNNDGTCIAKNNIMLME